MQYELSHLRSTTASSSLTTLHHSFSALPYGSNVKLRGSSGCKFGLNVYNLTKILKIYI